MKSSAELSKQFEARLNRHGYVFHQSLLIWINQIEASHWYVHSQEFPVQVGGRDTRIDLILKHRSDNSYMIVECKRANPALFHWCFAKTVELLPGGAANSILAEVVKRTNAGKVLTTSEPIHHSEKVYRFGFELKSDKRGDPASSGRGEIEHACTQVLAGMNGFVEYLANHDEILENGQSIKLLPVVITTANLWVSDVDLAAGDRKTGELDLADEQLRSEDWLYYHYSQSPGIKHSQLISPQPKNLRDSLYREYVRSIVFVHPSGLERFLSWNLWL